MNGIRLLGILFLFCIVTSCGPRSLDDFEEEGEGIVRSLIQELEMIQSREQLLVNSTLLQRHFDRLVNTMIAAEEWISSHPEQCKMRGIPPNHELSDLLRIELNRLYCLEGGRQIIEKCQEKALHRLDAFEQKRLRTCPKT